MNIKKIINLILITSLTVININSSGDKKRKFSYDDSDANKKIKIDPKVLAEWAKEKNDLVDKNKIDKAKVEALSPVQKDNLAKAIVTAKKTKKQPFDLDFTNIPKDLQEIIAKYLEDDWYLYDSCELGDDQYINMLSFSFDSDKVFLLMGNENYSTVFDVLKKSFFSMTFVKTRDLDNRITQHKKVILNEDEKTDGKYFIPLFDVNNEVDTDNHDFWVDETYFSKDKILSGIFSLSPCRNYLAFSNRIFFKIWNLNTFKQDEKKEITEKNCIITYDFKNSKDKEQDNKISDSDIAHLSFSDCGNYLVILGKGHNNRFCFICNIRTKIVTNLIALIDGIEDIWSYHTLAFSQNNKYLAISGGSAAFIFKNRQNGFE